MEKEEHHPIRRFCRFYGISQAQFASETGFTTGFISQLVTGVERCGRGAASRIQEKTGGEITVTELFEYEDEHNVKRSGESE